MAHLKERSNVNKTKVSIHWIRVDVHTMLHTFLLFELSQIPRISNIDSFECPSSKENRSSAYTVNTTNISILRWTNALYYTRTTVKWISANDLKSITISKNKQSFRSSFLFMLGNYVFRMFESSKWSLAISKNQTISFPSSSSSSSHIFLTHPNTSALILYIWNKKR